DAAIKMIARTPNGGVIVPPQAYFAANRAHLIAWAARERLPVVYSNAFFVRDGGLLSYWDSGSLRRSSKARRRDQSTDRRSDTAKSPYPSSRRRCSTALHLGCRPSPISPTSSPLIILLRRFPLRPSFPAPMHPPILPRILPHKILNRPRIALRDVAKRI